MLSGLQKWVLNNERQKLNKARHNRPLRGLDLRKRHTFCKKQQKLRHILRPVLAALCNYHMKYKNIDSALHNFGQSFLSGMNYFEDDHVMYDVFNVAKNLHGEVYSINFSTGA